MAAHDCNHRSPCVATRETKIKAAFELWNNTAQDDYHLAGHKEHLDDLMNQKKILMTLLAGRQTLGSLFLSVPELFPGTNYLLEQPPMCSLRQILTPLLIFTNFQELAVAVLQEVRCGDTYLTNFTPPCTPHVSPHMRPSPFAQYLI